MRRFWIVLTMVCVLTAGLAGYRWYKFNHQITWHQVNRMIHRQFPQVLQISVSAFQTWMADSRKPKPLLLDVRARAEYQVSHLHHAVWINADEPLSKTMAEIPKDLPIVAYCSVGYRSSAYCARLIKDGFSNVHDLQGSIFKWADSGLPVYRDGRIVHHVHPYDRNWGRLLNRQLWKFHPP